MKRKILIDLTLLKSPNTGLGTVAKSFSQGLEKSDISDLDFYFLIPPSHEKKQGKGITCITANSWKRYVPVFLPKVDIWHSTYQHFKFLRLANNTKQVITIHDLNFLYEKSTKKATRYLNIIQKKVDSAAEVIAISAFVAEDIKKHIDLKHKNVTVIYNAVDDLSTRADRKPDFIESGKPFFFTLGAIREKKNFHVLLDLMKRFPDIDLFICGSKDNEAYTNHILNRIETEKITNVKLTGAISEPEKIWLYRECAAFLFPSKFEGFGLPIIEAMHFGKPIFSSSMTSLKEVSGGFAFLWESFDTDTMEHQIRENLPSFYLDKTRVAKMKDYANTFNLDRHIDSHISLYRKLLQTN